MLQPHVIWLQSDCKSLHCRYWRMAHFRHHVIRLLEVLFKAQTLLVNRHIIHICMCICAVALTP